MTTTVPPAEADSATDTVTIVLADDHQVVRQGLRMLLEAEDGLEVLDEAGDAEGALRKVLAYHPDVLVLDLNMPGEPSLTAIPRILETSSNTNIVILTMQDDPAFAREALRAGAVGYVLKDAADTELVQAVRMAAMGRTYLNPELGARLAAAPSGPPDNLSERELQVLKMIALGYTNSEIASELFLSVRTVESHRGHLQHKTQCSTRSQLVAYARRHRLLD
jgi:two-component system, NarL family, response regulator NreC